MKLFLLIFGLSVSTLYAQRDFSTSEITKVILLGSGTPVAEVNRSGCSIAIVVNGMPYIVDFGPGLIRQLATYSEDFGKPEHIIPGLQLRKATRGFLTHLHSDHTTGYPDFILTPWVPGEFQTGRQEPAEVYGPEGISKMTKHILEAYEEDIKYRLYGAQPTNDQGWRVNSFEILKEGIIYEDRNVKVEAFPVPHGNWPNAWGYRFTTPDKVVVISGDTAYSDKIASYATGADILLHEAASAEMLSRKDPFWQNYHSKNHTSTHQLGELASKAKPKLTVVYHVLHWGASEESMVEEIAQKYDGKVIIGRDLDIY